MGVQGYSPGKLERSRSDEVNERSLFTESSQLAQGQEQELGFTRVEGLPVGVFPGVSLGFICWLALTGGNVINSNLSFSDSDIAVILDNYHLLDAIISSGLLVMPTDSKSKKSAAPVDEVQGSEFQPDPDGFLTELNSWGSKPNPASFEKLLETNQEKFALALSQGYGAEDICRLAATYGIKVQPSTFRKYWQRLNAKVSSESTQAVSSKPSANKSSVKSDSPASTSANSAVNF